MTCILISLSYNLGNDFTFVLFFPDPSRHCEEHYYNGSLLSRLEESVPDYFSGAVLLRSTPARPDSSDSSSYTGELRFQSLFNVVVIWMAVFIALSRGLRSYGKVQWNLVHLVLTLF